MNEPTGGNPKDFADTEPLSLSLASPEQAAAGTAGRPRTLATVRPAPISLDGLSLEAQDASLYEVMGVVRRDNRVCPQPSRWLEFYRVLQDAAPAAARPPEPVIGSAWAVTPPLAKRTLFEQQLEWADQNKALQAAYEFLKALRDTDWYCS
jgi:hypothetical protein